MKELTAKIRLPAKTLKKLIKIYKINQHYKTMNLSNITIKEYLSEKGISFRESGKELITKYDPVNNKSLRPDNTPNNQAKKTRLSRDKRLPIPGTVVTKEYKDAMLEVKILERGFEYNGKVYKSLTAIAKEVTGAHWNGFLFFRI